MEIHEVSDAELAAASPEYRAVLRRRVMEQMRELARQAKTDGLTEAGDVIEDVAAWEVEG